MDENTPFLQNSSTINRHKPLNRLSTANRQMSLPESGAVFRGQSIEFIDGAIVNLETIHEGNSLSSSQDGSYEEVCVEEISYALCSAWKRTRKPKAEITLDFFTKRELYEMHKAWKEITKGKHWDAEAHIIAEALAESMSTVITPKVHLPSENLSFTTWNLGFLANKRLLAANLLREWEKITEGDNANYSILEDCDSDNQSPDESERVSGFGQRPAQLCDTIRSLILHIWFQFLLHSLLIIWPISILIIATKYLNCSVNQALLYLLMILGVIGCLAIAIRLMLILLTGRTQDAEALYWRWMGLRFTELCFLIVFIIQAYHVFDTKPPTEPVSDHCVGKFYSAVLKMNYVSISLLLVHFIVYANKIYLNFFRASQ